MRIIVAAATAAGLFMTAGCSKSEATVKAEARAEIYNSCKSEGGSQTAQVPGLNLDQMCGCVADKITQNRSADEINRLKADDAAQGRAGAEAAIECMSAQAQGAAGAAQPGAAEAPANSQ